HYPGRGATQGFAVSALAWNARTLSFVHGFREGLRDGVAGLRAYRPNITTTAVVLGSLAIALISAALLTATLSTLYSDAIDRSKGESAEFAAVLAGQTSRSVEAINLMLEELAQRIVARAGEHEDGFDLLSDEQTHRSLKQRLHRLPFAE